jgi:hypothetical protein
MQLEMKSSQRCSVVEDVVVLVGGIVEAAKDIVVVDRDLVEAVGDEAEVVKDAV